MPVLPPGRDPAIRPAGHRVQARCDHCGAIDTHPRHTHFWDDGRRTDRHFDCCAAAGCPDSSCVDLVPGSGQSKGNDLVAFLHSPSFAEVVMVAASRGAPWAFTASVLGSITPPSLKEG